MYFYTLLIMYLCIEGWSSMRAVSLLLSSRNLLMLLSTNVSLWPCVQCSVETVGALLMLSHWVGGWGNHCWSVGGQCSLPSLVFVILEQQCSGEMVSNQFNVKCRNKSFRQNGFISKDDLCQYNQFRMASFSNWRFIPPSSSSGYGHDGHGGHGGLKSNQAVLDHLPIHPN